MRWREVEPLPDLNGTVTPVLSTVDALRVAWEESIRHASAEEFAEARQRSLRRHAIETGIIERLYDLDWGVTEALVAEGITIEVAEREGGVSDDALRLISDQLGALEYLTEAVRDGRDLSIFFVRELHQLITQHQLTYEGRNALGHLVQVPLPHGEWKTHANHVRRGDGTMLEYTPPEHVQAQMERLVKLHAEMTDVHPVVRAAWLHHRFICIHPFTDGNGRVARALTLLVLLQARHAPLVVDRRNREDYIRALDAANDNDLRPLIRLFAQLEIVALRTEIERPAVVRPASQNAVDIALAYAERIERNRDRTTMSEIEEAAALSEALTTRMRRHLQDSCDGLVSAFKRIDPAAEGRLSVRGHGTRGLTLVGLTITVLDLAMHYRIVVTVDDPNVLVVSVAAWADARKENGQPLFASAPTDTVTLLRSDNLDVRWLEVEDLIDRTLSAAVDAYGQRLSQPPISARFGFTAHARGAASAGDA
ncbi:hypothetical protein GCM10009682_61990 [Luedemannella flava]|uniref:Fido domain-containing protein n=1 Tax=Luedemannella flava TaxID=349316 RepID=A0ABN2MRU4_9ACTN